MQHKETVVNTKTQKLPQKKNERVPKIPPGKDKDFGGIPDFDPKKFLGCG